jgi:acyl-CoA thioesterase-1
MLAGLAGPSGASAAAAATAPERTLLVLGDSLSAGYGLEDIQKGWVALLQRRLKSQGYGYRVVNASVSGETSSGGLNRLPRALSIQKPDVVILELGANDGLRGLPLETTRANLARIVDLSTQAGSRVLLLGMQIPPNYGPRYTEGFATVFSSLARERQLPFVPFFLDKVALQESLMQEDGLHPRAEAQPQLLENIWPTLRELLKRGG